MNDDELSDRLRHLVDRAQPVDLDEVTHRRVVAGRRPLVVALAGVAVVALVAGAVALLRIDRDDTAPVVTAPTTTVAPATTSTTVPAATTTGPGPEIGDTPQFVGITTDGRLVVVNAGTGEELLELDRMGDPNAPNPEEGPGPNYIESVDILPGSPSQVLYGDCCEPVSGTIYGIGLDGSATTLPVLEQQDDRTVVAGGITPAIRADGWMAAASAGSALVIFNVERGVGGTRVDPDLAGSGTAPTWLNHSGPGAPELAYELFEDGRPVLRIVPRSVDGDMFGTSILPPAGSSYTDPIGLGDEILVVEQQGGDPNVPDSYESSTARFIDPISGEVLRRSFVFDGIVVDLDTNVDGALLATFTDGRVARIDTDTGESQDLASGFNAASW